MFITTTAVAYGLHGLDTADVGVRVGGQDRHRLVLEVGDLLAALADLGRVMDARTPSGRRR